MHRPSAPACQIVFLDAGTLPCGLPLEQYLDAPLLSRLAYQAHERTAPAEVAARIAQAEVVVTNKVRLTAELLTQAPRLQRICIAAAGMDNVDLQAARSLGITVHNVPDYGSDSVAEHVVATLLALRRHLAAYSAAATDGRWSASPHFLLAWAAHPAGRGFDAGHRGARAHRAGHSAAGARPGHAGAVCTAPRP